MRKKGFFAGGLLVVFLVSVLFAGAALAHGQGKGATSNLHACKGERNALSHMKHKTNGLKVVSHLAKEDCRKPKPTLPPHTK